MSLWDLYSCIGNIIQCTSIFFFSKNTEIEYKCNILLNWFDLLIHECLDNECLDVDMCIVCFCV